MLPASDVAAQSVPDAQPWQFEAIVGSTYSTDARTFGVLIHPRWQVAADMQLSRGAFYAGTESGIGFNVIKSATSTLGIGLDYRSGRQQSAEAIYQGLGNVPGSLALAGNFEWTPLGPALTFYGGVEIAATHRDGTNYTLGVRAGAPLIDGMTAFVDASMSGADRRYSQTFYGVTAAQSLSSGLPGYTLGAGPINLTVALGVLVDIYPHWQVIATAGRMRYVAEVAQSPLITGRAYPLGLLAVDYSF